MVRRYIFTDEAGDFTFNRGQNIPRYFIVCSLTVESCDIGTTLLDLRRELQWEGVSLTDGFHATTDEQSVRSRVYSALGLYDFRVDATILDKPKAQPKTRTTKEQFYKYAWYYHFKHIGPQIAPPGTELLITTVLLERRRVRPYIRPP